MRTHLVTFTLNDQEVRASLDGPQPFPTSDLKHYRYNPECRTKMEERRNQVLLEDVRKNGVLRPLDVVLTAKGLEVADGNRRLAAARAAGLKSVPGVLYKADAGTSPADLISALFNRAEARGIAEPRPLAQKVSVVLGGGVVDAGTNAARHAAFVKHVEPHLSEEERRPFYEGTGKCDVLGNAWNLARTMYLTVTDDQPPPAEKVARLYRLALKSGSSRGLIEHVSLLQNSKTRRRALREFERWLAGGGRYRLNHGLATRFVPADRKAPAQLRAVKGGA